MNKIDLVGMIRGYKEIIMRFRDVPSRVQFAIAILSLFCLASVAALAQTTSNPVASTAVARGRDTFQQSCALCHGERGKGDGLAASALTPRPVDLTILTKRNGTFPAAHIEAVLKGTDPVAGHSPTMMIWRSLFLADANGNEALADARASDLVTFIESIQVK